MKMFYYHHLVIISFTLLSRFFLLICFSYIRCLLRAYSLIIRLTSSLFPCFHHACLSPPCLSSCLLPHFDFSNTLLSFVSFSLFSTSLCLLLLTYLTHYSSFLRLCRQNVSFHQLSSPSQKVHERLKELEQEVSGGATAVVALILNNKLYIANVGMHTHSCIDTQTLTWQ